MIVSHSFPWCAQFTCHVRACTGVPPPVVRAETPAAGRRRCPVMAQGRLLFDFAPSANSYVDSHNDVCSGNKYGLSQGSWQLEEEKKKTRPMLVFLCELFLRI